MSNGENRGLVQQGAAQSAGDVISRGQTLQQIQTRYATAVSVQVPRDLKQVVKRCIEEAELSGDSFYYRWLVTSKKTGKTSPIQGPSVKLALSAIRNFGNVAVEQQPVQETREAYIFTTAVVDLETGYTFSRSFRMSKDYPIYGEMDKYRKDDIRFQIGQSKSTRNAVANVVPQGIIDKMMEAAMNSVRTKIEEKIRKAGGEIGKVIDQMLIAFAKSDVTQKMIEDKIGLKADKWDVESLTMLAGDLKALQTGDETAQSLFGSDESDEKPETTTPAGLGDDDMAPGDPKNHQDIKGKDAGELPLNPGKKKG